MTDQLLDLSRPFPQRVIHDNPSGYGSYVAHHLYVQRLLMHLGPYSFELVEILRGDTAEVAVKNKTYPALENVVVGVVMRLVVTIDGERVRIEEVGDCELPANWPHDGARLKDAMSDSLKRCCARIGLGTHLYAKSSEEYVLFQRLKDQMAEPDADDHEPARVRAPRPVEDTADPTLADAPLTGWTEEDDPGRPFE